MIKIHLLKPLYKLVTHPITSEWEQFSPGNIRTWTFLFCDTILRRLLHMVNFWTSISYMRIYSLEVSDCNMSLHGDAIDDATTKYDYTYNDYTKKEPDLSGTESPLHLLDLLKFVLVNKDFQTWHHLIGLQYNRQLVTNHESPCQYRINMVLTWSLIK